ncbi:unnamed protein product [Cylindrotheca closterium]|uniref:COX assembly mitochondrial protein n=1 Tax=Cylindrotheca closterium TaxID=2856 RepID=A0AAD2FB84_9STRA|nr:unnamed protein product [Cylindrotheca closterium]
MHPPLDRPHPDCQEAIDELRNCQKTRSRIKVWACNELKHRLDDCFKEEKQKILLDMNKGFAERRLLEDEQAAKSTGKNMTFQEYLKKDKEYQKEIESIKKSGSSWFG